MDYKDFLQTLKSEKSPSNEELKDSSTNQNSEDESLIPVGIVIHDKEYNNLNEDAHSTLSKNYQFTPEEQSSLEQYKLKSFKLNAHLLGHHIFGKEPSKTFDFLETYKHGPTTRYSYNLDHLDSALNKKPLTKKLTVYSGLGFDPRKNVSKEGLIHFPAYTSTSIHKKVAKSFASENEGEHHVLKIQLNPGDHGAYIGGLRHNEVEKEFLLPRNTTLRIHKHEIDSDGTHIHHAIIEHNVDPTKIRKNKNDIVGLHPNFHKVLMESDYTHPEIKDFIKNHPKLKSAAILSSTNPEEIDKHKDSKEFEHLEAITKNPYTSSDTLHHIATTTSSYGLLKNIAKHPNIGIESQKEIYKTLDTGLHTYLASNEKIHPGILHLLGDSDNRFVLSHVRDNPNTKFKTLVKMHNSEKNVGLLRDKISSEIEHKATKEDLDELKHHEHFAHKIINHPLVTPEILHHIANNKSFYPETRDDAEEKLHKINNSMSESTLTKIKNILNESNVPVVSIDKNSININDIKTQTEINKNLKVELSHDFYNINEAMNRVRKILDMYSIQVKRESFIDSNAAISIIPVAQFGNISGISLSGKYYHSTENEDKFFLVFVAIQNSKGLYSCHASLHSEDGLEHFMEKIS